MGRLGATEIFIVLVPFLTLYFLPSFIALARKRRNRAAIIVLNLFLGWTFIGWIASLIWAFASNNETQTIVVNNSYPKEENFSDAKKDFNDKMDHLQKLKDLLDSGILSKEEFVQQKAKILAS